MNWRNHELFPFETGREMRSHGRNDSFAKPPAYVDACPSVIYARLAVRFLLRIAPRGATRTTRRGYFNLYGRVIACSGNCVNQEVSGRLKTQYAPGSRIEPGGLSVPVTP